MQDFKKEAAKEAVTLIRPGQRIGLGAGSTMAQMIDQIKTDRELLASITTVTSSFTTRLLLEKEGFVVKAMGSMEWIDLYFDGCDQFDRSLNALKSGGGVHALEKIVASMAGEFILVGDESKRVEELDIAYPLVLEVIPDALSFVSDQLKRSFDPRMMELRLSNKKDGAVITERGNFLIDLWFSAFPEPSALNDQVNKIPGILEHSLFFNLASRAIVAGAGGITRYSR